MYTFEDLKKAEARIDAVINQQKQSYKEFYYKNKLNIAKIFLKTPNYSIDQVTHVIISKAIRTSIQNKKVEDITPMNLSTKI